MVKDTFFRFWHEFRFYSKWFKLATFFVLLQLLFAIIYIFPYSEATPSRELTRLDLPLENFGFKVLYRPNEQYLRSTNAVLPSVVRAAFNETNDLPYQVKFEYSSLLPDADFLLRNTTFAQLPDWDGTVDDCRFIIFTSGDQQPSEETFNSRFNHRRYAEINNACLLHLACKDNVGPLDHAASQSVDDYFLKSFHEAFGTNYSHRMHYIPSGNCGSKLNGFYWKFIGMSKLSKSLTTAIPTMFIDLDVLFMNFSVTPVDLPYFNSEEALFVVGTDYSAGKEKFIYDLPSIRIPLNSGVMLMNLPNRDVESLAAQTLSLWQTPDLYVDALRKFWDTDQGPFTYVLVEKYGLPESELYKALNDKTGHRDRVLVEFDMETTKVRVVPQRSLAGVIRPFGNQNELSFQPGDWMTHVVPGLRKYVKKKALERYCAQNISGIREGCFFISMEDENETDEIKKPGD